MMWRVGRKVGRTLYWQAGPEPSDDDLLIGLMDTPELAERVVRAVNSRGDQSAEETSGMSRSQPPDMPCAFPACRAPKAIGIERLNASGNHWYSPIWYCDKHATLIVAKYPTTARRFNSLGDTP